MQHPLSLPLTEINLNSTIYKEEIYRPGSMAPFILIQFLFYITGIYTEDCPVDNCALNFCNDNTCSKCDASYFLTSEGGCSDCFLSCRECDDEQCYTCAHSSCHSCDDKCTCSEEYVFCSTCPEGYYKQNSKCYKCHFNQCTCFSKYDCTGCLPGYYGSSNNCGNRCPSNCLACQDTKCIKCIAGKYGPHCQNNCTAVCDDGTCEISSGVCASDCATGQYLSQNNTCQNCKPRCSKCTDYDNCSSCRKPYYWGKSCQYDCNGCFDKCDKGNGCDSACQSNYFQSFDKNLKGYICTRCPKTCAECSNLTLCSSCKTKYWGSFCQYNCTGCSSSNCSKISGCTTGCMDGYYKYVINEGFLCKECPEQCSICQTNSSCEECDDGYYLSHRLNCVPCPNHCKEGKCDKNNGSCTEGCKDSWSGWHCNESCPSNCEQCDPVCNSCKIGFYGDRCEQNCSFQCKEEGQLQTCNKSNGICLQGCKYGYWGQLCDLACELGCESEACNETTGLCLNGCKSNFFGNRCSLECSRNCLNDSQTSRQCDETSGNCGNGCKNGLFGNNCTAECSKACKQMSCFQHNGTCVYGYTENNAGIINTTVPGDHQGFLEPSETETNIALPVGGGAGTAVVIVIVIVIIVLIIRRRRETRKLERSEDTIDVVQGYNTPLQGDVTYATVNKNKPAFETIPETIILNDKSSVVMSNATRDVIADDVIVNIKPKHTTEIDSLKADTLTDSKSNRKAISNLSKKNQAKEKESSYVNMELGEASKDVLPKKVSRELVAKNDIVESDYTYYNTISNRVSISGLAEYIKNKDHNMMDKEFQKLPKGLRKDHKVAQNPRNAAKNRYKQIYPYDESRVILKDGGNDYVNASFVKGCKRPKEYIASSGPFQRGKSDNQTIFDLWRMIWQEQCETIVMLTKCYEDEEQKCEQYWPELGSSKQHGSLNVTCVTEDQYADFIIRSFIVKKDGQNLKTRHLQFTAWPDKGVPADVTSMIEFRQKVRSLHKDAVCPMLVHCSAGIGRTGTFIALDIQTNIGESSGYVDLFACVSELRNQRVNLVQTPEQYVYLHHAVLHALTFDSQSIPAENFIETYSRLIKKNEGQSHIQRQFLKLQSTIDEISAGDKKAIDQNRAFTDKNRNGADIPGDENRVILHGNRKPGSPNCINAVYINGFRSRNNFIAAQIPLPTTLVDFLSLIVQEKCSKVVMMEEVDIQNKTVGVFWPADNQVLKHGVFQVRCKGSKTSQTYKLKELSIESRTGKTAETLDVDLYIYTDWPKEAAVPQSSDSLLQLVKDVSTHNCQQEKDAPVLILCMTGAARSCLFCAVSVLIEKMEIEHEVSVVNTLRQIKARRRSAIPTLEQYKFCHQAVISYLQTFDIYSNFGLKEKEAN